LARFYWAPEGAGIAGPSPEPGLAALLARLKQLPPEQQKLVKDLIKALAG
jgi:hypothetical protein